MANHRAEKEGTIFLRHQVWWIDTDDSTGEPCDPADEGWWILSFDEGDDKPYDSTGPYESQEKADKLANSATISDQWEHTAFLIINKGSMEVYMRSELSEVAFIVGRDESDIHWALKRTGRWDRDDDVITVIPSKPDSE